jgi:UDP-N-acetylmuramoyl-tripeptide--D-alanyl-D-alanine ligase
MILWGASEVAALAGAELVGPHAPGDAAVDAGPLRVVIDSREARAGDLFVGLAGARSDGGDHAPDALASGAWGVLVTPAKAAASLAAAPGGAAVLAHADPLLALQRLAGAWRTELGAEVVAITGSTGKTSTKDILAALLAGSPGPGLRTAASPENYNTEIGLPLAILAAPRGTDVVVLELAMRGPGQIAELTAIARPDVGLILNIGPVHLEQLGSLEAVAAAKAELIAGLASGKTVVVPASEPLLAPYRRDDLRTITFGAGGDVELAHVSDRGEVLIRAGGRSLRLRPSFTQAYNRRNLLAAVAVAEALGVEPGGQLDVRFSALRGEHLQLSGGVLLINDCYNANPMSMRAALDDLAATARARRVAVLGDMLELGSEEQQLHRELGAYAAARGVDVLITVGARAKTIGDALRASSVEVHCARDAEEAATLVPTLLRAADTVLVKGSRGMRLELVAEALSGSAQPPHETVVGHT